MKNIKYIALIFLMTSMVMSCDEQEFLNEVPYDFYSPENSFSTPEQIDIAVVQLYARTRSIYVESSVNTFAFHYITDVGFDCISTTHALASWNDNINPNTGEVFWAWSSFYKIITDANTLIDRIEFVEYDSEAEKNAKIGEAMFFRAFAYRSLAILFGDVPLITEEVTSPKRDFVRAPVADVWDQVVEDLLFAEANLPGANDIAQDGRIAKAAARHLLAEVYITKQEYDKAIAAATSVIDDPDYQLMESRFGSRIDEPGDVYWDLFRRGNVNRGNGNTEAIWVSQYEHLQPGGGSPDNLARFLAPLYWQLKDNDGVNCFFSHSSQNGGRGIGWWRATDFMLDEIWDSDTDMRNSEHNVIRDVVIDNPESAYYGQMLVASGAISNFSDPLRRYWSAIWAKSNPIGNFPDDLIANPETGQTANQASSTFNDRYMMRLAETYLLRAEAYLMKGDQANAAKDINIVRARVNADPVAAGDVDLDFLLDERARELFTEEFRLFTLMRTGKLVERVRKHHPYHNGQHESYPINDYNKLWPIPDSEIEKNTEAVIEQNAGYN